MLLRHRARKPRAIRQVVIRFALPYSFSSSLPTASPNMWTPFTSTDKRDHHYDNYHSAMNLFARTSDPSSSTAEESWAILMRVPPYAVRGSLATSFIP